MPFPGRLVLFACLCLACALAWAQQDADVISKYRLGTGDVITITVFGEDDLKKEHIRLTDAGTISYPVLGELPVRGKTVGDLEKMVTEGLRGRYLEHSPAGYRERSGGRAGTEAIRAVRVPVI